MLLAALSAGLCAAVPTGAAASAAPEPLDDEIVRLFGPEVSEPVGLGPPRPYEKARRLMRVNWPALRPLCDPLSPQRRDPLQVELFPRVETTAYPYFIGNPMFRFDSLSWQGVTPDEPPGRVRLTALGLCGKPRADWTLAGSVKIGDTEYRIEPRRDRALVIEVDLLAGTSQILPAPRPGG